MQPGLHYDPSHTTTFTADRTTQRMLIALHATHKLPLEHFDIKSAYLHEKYQHDRPIYVKQMQRFDGSHKHRENMANSSAISIDPHMRLTITTMASRNFSHP